MTPNFTQQFAAALAQAQRAHGHNAKTARQHWLFVPYDQLNDQLGPLQRLKPADVGIVCVETAWMAQQRDYHKQKLALVWANQRHFALEQARRGVAVRYIFSDASYGKVLHQLAAEIGGMQCMEPAERELRVDLQQHAAQAISFVPHTGWLSQPADLHRLGEPPWRMDAFYRHMRRKTGLLMQHGKPCGGRWSFDADNRQAWHGKPAAPTWPSLQPDAITREVGNLVAHHYAAHFGVLDLQTLPATQADAQHLWDWAIQHCLPHFGPYEDAMSQQSASLFHTRLSALLNIHRLLPQQVLQSALEQPQAAWSLASQEGFVRQILGWREFMYQVHRATDGLRNVPTRNALQAAHPLPQAYWGEAPSGLHCLDQVVQDVEKTGYSHHITRLMVLSNIATLLDTKPRELTDWFWFAYVDAYDWVVEPNVMGMGTYALGDLFVTKPYISGAAYIHRMSDFCHNCAFKPQSNCPITPLYWAFLARHAKQLAANRRLAIPLGALRRRAAAKKHHDQQVYAWAQKTLQAKQALHPDTQPSP